MNEAILDKFIYNDNLLSVSEFNKIFNNVNPSIYEVIRIDNKVPLFLEDHLERLKNSGNIIGFPIKESYDNIRYKLNTMTTANNVTNCNIKIIMNSFDKASPDIYIYFIESNYPDEQLYNKGIDTMTYRAVRENPNAKIIYTQMRKDINDKLKEHNQYEALLINDFNNVTEGSRSNLFFIKNDEIYTAPSDEVLIGITRQKIITLCHRNSIIIHEASIALQTLSEFDACFISGTSPKVLPIKKIDDIHYSPDNPLLKRIITLYNAEIQNYYNSVL